MGVLVENAHRVLRVLTGKGLVLLVAAASGSFCGPGTACGPSPPLCASGQRTSLGNLPGGVVHLGSSWRWLCKQAIAVHAPPVSPNAQEVGKHRLLVRVHHRGPSRAGAFAATGGAAAKGRERERQRTVPNGGVKVLQRALEEQSPKRCTASSSIALPGTAAQSLGGKRTRSTWRSPSSPASTARCAPTSALAGAQSCTHSRLRTPARAVAGGREGNGSSNLVRFQGQTT